MSREWDQDEAAAFVETLFAKHHNEIYAYLLRMLREPELAADLTQDAFIKAYKSYDTLEKPENARAWLYQIAHRVALDDIRRRKIIRFFPWTGESRGSAPSAEHLVMDAHLSGDMQRALARIPERQRAALLLAELHDLTGVELAEALASATWRRAHSSPGPARASARHWPPSARPRPRLTRSEPQPRRRGESDDPHRARRPRPSPARPGGTLARPSSPSRCRAHRRPARPDRGSLAGPSISRRAPHVPPSPAPTKPIALRFARLRTVPLDPPRDLWARTAAGIERELRARPATGRSGRPSSRRSLPALGVLSGIAVIAVVIGATALSGGLLPGLPATGVIPAASASTVAEATQAVAGPTPMVVGAGDVRWVGAADDGAYAYNIAPVDEVAPTIRNRTARLSVTSTRSLWRSRPGHGRSSSRPRGTRRSSSVRMRPAAIR